MSERETFTARVAELFRSMPGQWIEAEVLSKVGGRCAWRTRVSELRHPPYAMTIENRQRLVETPLGNFKVSSYRYVPTPSRSGILERAEAQELPFA